MSYVSDWWSAAAIRAIKTMAQAALGVIGTSLIGILDIDWLNLLSVVLMAGVVSLLTSIAGLPEVDGGAPLSEVIDDQQAMEHARAVSVMHDWSDDMDAHKG